MTREPKAPPPYGLSLGRRLGLTFAAFAVLASAAVGASVWAYVRQIDARHKVISVIDEARVASEDLLADYVNEETGVRGYILSRDQSFLQPYTDGVAAVPGDHARLAADLGDDSTDRALLRTIDARVQAWERAFAQPAIASAKAGGTVFESTTALLKGKQLFDTSRSAFAALDSSLAASRVEDLHTLDVSQDTFVAVMLFAVLLLLVAGVVAWRSLRVWVTRPLAALGRDSRRVAGGDLDHEVTPTGPPDIAHLALDVDAMRQRVLTELHLLEDARAKVEEANTELRRSNVELEQFAYVASHDLQEPLRKVVSFCQLLERRYKGQLDERADEYIGFAVDGASRMQVLINDLLSFSRVGRTTEKFEPVDLNRALELAMRNLDGAITDAGATIESGLLPSVFGDPSLLTALLQNLLGNAIKFRGDAPPVVKITSAPGPGEWNFAAEDNGIGIEPRFAERVFIIFQRLHGRDVYAGTGIGLALCKKIVEFHGGSIWVDTQYHPGTRICWTIPERAGK